MPLVVANLYTHQMSLWNVYRAQASVKRLMPILIEHVRTGRINPKEIITHRIPLEELGEAYHIFSSKLDNCIKPLLIPHHARA